MSVKDLIPITWGIEIPEDLAEEAEALFTKLSERRMCKLFVSEEGKCVMPVDGKLQICLTASVTPEEYISGLPPQLIRKLFDNAVANRAFRDGSESKILQPDYTM